MKLGLAVCLLAASSGLVHADLPPLNTIFIIMMENYDWSSIKGNSSAPYINGSLLPMASYCEQYYNPAGIHPSEPNYLWLEAGTNFGIFNDYDPAVNHQSTTNHLVTQLDAAGISWKTYQEDISGTYVPLTSTNNYATWHNPFVYFDDVTGTNNPNYPYGIAHIRPLSELLTDLAKGTVARYNFITPNLCHDMHYTCSPLDNQVQQGDAWLAGIVPQILASAAHQNGGALFIVWDEGGIADGPIGMIVLSPWAQGGGYFNYIRYTHSSLLRSVQLVFGVRPFLAQAAQAQDLGDLFGHLRFSSINRFSDGRVQLAAIGVIPHRTHLVQASLDLTNWTAISTNVVPTNSFTVVDTAATNHSVSYYRLVRLP